MGSVHRVGNHGQSRGVGVYQSDPYGAVNVRGASGAEIVFPRARKWFLHLSGAQPLGLKLPELDEGESSADELPAKRPKGESSADEPPAKRPKLAEEARPSRGAYW